jgi:hypothetical protein
MPTATIRRRVRNLETVLALALMPDALPFTLSEIESIAERARTGGMISREERQRVARLSPIVGGEYGIACYNGTLTVKHYDGVDSSEI